MEKRGFRPANILEVLKYLDPEYVKEDTPFSNYRFIQVLGSVRKRGLIDDKDLAGTSQFARYDDEVYPFVCKSWKGESNLYLGISKETYYGDRRAAGEGSDYVVLGVPIEEDAVLI